MQLLVKHKKNVVTFSIILLLVNLIFLCLGALIYIYVQAKGISIPQRTTDDLFPSIALSLGTASSLFFIIGLISAAYPSADGALTALTTSVCIDFLSTDERTELDEKKKTRLRHIVHILFGVILLAVIIIFRMINDQAVVTQLFKIANYTYGPLLGLFAFGILSKRKVMDKMSPAICIVSPVICFFLDKYSKTLFSDYLFGNELLILNGIFTFIGLYIFSKKQSLS